MLHGSLRELYARTIGVAARIREIVAAQQGMDLAFVFGSYARGSDDPTSDIDVFVLGEPDWAPLEDESRKLFDELGREVNFVGWHRDDLRRAVQDRSPFLETLRRSKKIWIVGDEDELDRRIDALGRETRRRRPAARRRTGRAGKEARPGPPKPRPRARRPQGG
jgi:predicted nucleotidyltransferase